MKSLFVFWRMDKNIHSVWPDFFFPLFRRWSSYFSVSKLGHLTCSPPPHRPVSSPFRPWKPAQRLPSCYRTSVRRKSGPSVSWRSCTAARTPPRASRRSWRRPRWAGDLQPRVPPRLAPGCVGARCRHHLLSARLCSNRFSFPPVPLNPRGLGTFSPKGRSVCHRRCESKDVLMKTFPSCLFSSDPLTCAGGLMFISVNWDALPEVFSSFPLYPCFSLTFPPSSDNNRVNFEASPVTCVCR